MLRRTIARGSGRLTAPAMGLAMCVLVACGPSRIPHLGAGPFTPGRAELFDRALAVSAAHGYPPQQIDPVGGTFVVRARSSGTGHRFTVRCLRDGWVSVEPDGPAVVEEGTELVVSRRVRDEYFAYVGFFQDELGYVR